MGFRAQKDLGFNPILLFYYWRRSEFAIPWMDHFEIIIEVKTTENEQMQEDFSALSLTA